MGLDGGTIPTRGELVQMKKKPEQKDKASDTQHKWNNCTITQLPLELPIVCCHMGMLFNKQSILELLLGKRTDCTAYSHIESTRDVRELELTPNRTRTEGSADYVCPVTGVEMNGKHRFVCLWECGCVLSERAIRLVSSSMCHKCGTPFSKENVIVMNPHQDDMEKMRVLMAKRKANRLIAKADETKSCKSINSKSESLLNKHDATKPLPSTSKNTSDTVSIPHGSNSSSSCVVTEKKKRLRDFDKSEYSNKKSKHKKHKEHKHKKSKKEKKLPMDINRSSKPIMHPGWSEILAKNKDGKVKLFG